MVKTVKRDSAVTKARILIVAENLFAEKGFDGTRVDEIAAKAQVNKALIYYYFKSKDDILEALFSSAIRDVILTIEKTHEDFKVDEVEIEQIFKLMIDLLTPKKQILKVMYMESLKKTTHHPYLFRIAEFFISSEVDTIFRLSKEKGHKIPEPFSKQLMMVTEFYTSFLPVINYVIFSEDWCKTFKTKPEELEKLFLTSFKFTHVAYHNKMLG